LAAQLGFTIERDTRNYLRKHSSKIKETASERITQELFKLLMTENASYYMSLCEKDKVLHKILNVTNAKIKDNLLMLIKFDQFIKRFGSGKFKKLFYSRISPLLNSTISQGLSRSGLIRLSILLNNMNRANANKCFNLRYSKSIMKRVMNIQDGMMLTTGRITKSKLYDVFTAAVDCEYEAALIVSVTRQNNVDKFINRANDYIKFKKYPLLDGHEIQKILNIGPSALIGKIQVEVHKRRFLGIIRTKTEAQHWIISNLT
ncbi:MAG: hypothetical protein HZC49_06650, partial [Nitrospirae bacterium]|nr:hypothetical protein [Nitrospirota bacterium]